MVSRTINPLHFEDLEPHRFEDLVRQLAYDYRPWKVLDATGRLGADGGLDIRGIELVSISRQEPLYKEPEDTEGDELVETPVEEEREWRIQCKRYQRINPQLMKDIVGEVIPEGSAAPYGLIVAAACDVSAATMSAFREAAAGRGVRESHLWVKAHLEDMLFQPENDHLLFAYFGISLQMRQRSQLQEIRALMVIKRKLLRAFKAESISGNFGEALIRNLDDYRYREWNEELDALDTLVRPWHVVRIKWAGVGGLAVCPRRYQGWVREDGSWDILEEPLASATMNGSHEEQEELGALARRLSEDLASQLEGVPQSEQALVDEIWALPYRSIMEIDPIGDPTFEGCHIYCRFDGDHGPYIGDPHFIAHPGVGVGMKALTLEPENRRPLFRRSRRR